MNNEIIEILEYNILAELKKKELSTEHKAALLKDYMERTKTSLRGLAKELNVPHTTLFYWANETKKVEHAAKVLETKNHGELDYLIESLKTLLNRIEEKKVKLTDKDRLAIEKMKDLSYRIYMLTRTVKV